MNLNDLCRAIALPPEVEASVLSHAREADTEAARRLLNDMLMYDRLEPAAAGLKALCGEDEDGMKGLTYLLLAAGQAYALYRAAGIDDAVYIATMKCFSRFLEETHRITGHYVFDRAWWVGRHVGLHLFRLGTLEFERLSQDGRTVISIHIPTDACFTPEAVEASLREARAFFPRLDPSLVACEYVCSSWLLDPQLKTMLPDSSNILRFQERFVYDRTVEAGTGYFGWVFGTKPIDHALLPENTTLQRNLKRHLLAGGKLYNTLGHLR